MIDEYVRRFRFSEGWWTVNLARALARRGHQIRVVVDGVEDPAPFARAQLEVRRQGAIPRLRDPLGFQRWALARSREGWAEGVLSLSRLVPAGLWLATERPLWRSWMAEVTEGAPLSVPLEAAARPWLAAGLLAEGRSRRLGRRALPARFGAAPGGEAIGLGYASTIPELDPYEIETLSERVREHLSIPRHEVVLLLAAVKRGAEEVAPVIDALGRLARQRRDVPWILGVTLQPYTMTRRLRRARLEERSRVVGPTESMADLLAASDVVAAVGRNALGSGRLIADALRMGRPVAADAEASGAALLEASGPGAEAAGWTTGDRTVAGWARVLEEALDEPGRARAARAARRQSPSLAFEALVDRVEGALEDTAHQQEAA